jgi:hypothetical protein
MNLSLPDSLTCRASPINPAAGSEWVAAGYSGEGMVHAWRSGIVVAQMVLEGLSSETNYNWQEWFPAQLLTTKQRIKDSTFGVSVVYHSMITK